MGTTEPTTSESATLSLSDLHRHLTERGVTTAYSSLSQFIATGDIAEQLGVGGKGNRREFPRWTVDFLADFMPKFEAAKMSKSVAPEVIRRALPQFQSSGNFMITAGGGGLAFTSGPVAGFAELENAETIRVLASAIRETLADLVPVRDDRLLTRAQAAQLLACHPRSVGRYVRPVRRGTWRWSDLMAYVGSLSPRG